MLAAMDKSNDKFTLAYANRLYASQSYDLQPTYVSKLQLDYRSEIKKVEHKIDILFCQLFFIHRLTLAKMRPK